MHSKAVPVPSSYIVKYNNYIDTIFERINNVLKKNYDPVNVRLQTAPNQKKKPGAAKHSSKYKRRPTRPSSRDNESNNSTSTVRAADQDEVQHRSARAHSRTDRRIHKRKTQNKPKNSQKPSKKIMRAKAVLYGLSSLRRDGDVLVHVLNTHTTIKSRFLVGPLTLKVEKEFGRGAKKEMRSATATTAEMFGKLNLKVVNGGDTALSSIKVMQPKQMRVETLDDHDQTKEFLWKRSSNLAHLVSQKLANAAKSFIKPKPVADASSAQNQTVVY